MEHTVPAPQFTPPVSQQSQTNRFKLVGLVFASALLLAAVGAIGYYIGINQQNKTKTPAATPSPSPSPIVEEAGVICTMDAKLCPDGSYVGRSGPNCEFAACPGEATR